MADQFQMTDVVSALEVTVLEHLNINVCGDVMNWSIDLGLRQVEATARKLATERFEQLAKSDDFMLMHEEVLA